MNETQGDASMLARESVINAKNKLDKLRTARNLGEVDAADFDEHREAESTAAAELEDAKANWYRIDPENAPNPKVSPYIYP